MRRPFALLAPQPRISASYAAPDPRAMAFRPVVPTVRRGEDHVRDDSDPYETPTSDLDIPADMRSFALPPLQHRHRAPVNFLSSSHAQWRRSQPAEDEAIEIVVRSNSRSPVAEDTLLELPPSSADPDSPTTFAHSTTPLKPSLARDLSLVPSNAYRFVFGFVCPPLWCALARRQRADVAGGSARSTRAFRRGRSDRSPWIRHPRCGPARATDRSEPPKAMPACFRPRPSSPAPIGCPARARSRRSSTRGRRSAGAAWAIGPPSRAFAVGACAAASWPSSPSSSSPPSSSPPVSAALERFPSLYISVRPLMQFTSGYVTNHSVIKLCAPAPNVSARSSQPSHACTR